MRRALLIALALTVSACGPSGSPDAVPEPDPAAGSPPVATAPASAASTLEPYVNARFGFAVDVPAAFEAQPAPQNADGRTFRSPDGAASLVVFGYQDAVGAGLEGLAERAREDLDSLAYSARPPGGIVASGPAGEDVVYARALYRDGVGVLARLRYQATRPEGGAWAEALDASLRWTE
jgi:hypothetical protein